MKSAEQIFVAANVITVNGAQPRAEAVAVREGRIQAVGKRETILAMGDANTETVDLGEHTLLPGLVEPHTHPDLCGQCYSWIDVSGFSHADASGVEEALREAVERAEPGQWLFAFGLDPMLTRGLGVWNRERLDTIAPQNPLAVMIQSMHTLFVNSLALETAGVDENTPNPPNGGEFHRGTDGRLNGRVTETSAALYFLAFVDFARETVRDRIWQQYGRYAAAGLTTIGMPGLFMPVELLDCFEELAAREDLPVRNVAYLRHHQVEQVGRRPGDGDDRFRIQGVKLWYDGSPYSGTMLLDEPYLETRLCACKLGIPAGTRGHANFATEEFREIVADLHRDGWQVLTHAQGDRGTREILDLYEEALRAHPREDHRWRVEHCALISPQDLERARELGVSPSFHMNHVYYYGNELRDDIIGAERAAALMPVGTAVSLGHRVSLHADSPMYPPEPFRLMSTAVNRRTRQGDELGPGEAIDTDQALRAVTIDAAWQLFADDRLGSLEEGKLADFTVVDRDLLEADPKELASTEVVSTWLGGRKVHG